MKKVIATLLISFISPLVVFAAFNDVQLSSGSTLQITIGSSVLDLTVTDGNVQDFNIEGGIIYFTLASGSGLTITSASRTTFNYAIGAATTSFECGSSSSVLSISLPNGSDLSFSVTPNNVTCTAPASQNTAVSTPVQSSVTQPEEPAVSVSVPEPAPQAVTALAQVQAQVQAPAPATPAVPATPSEAAKPSPVAQLVSPAFNKDLQLGSRGDDVKRLQELLKTDKDVYPEGLVTGYYGPLTKAAILKLQMKHGVIKTDRDRGAGRLGPKTRAKVKEVFESPANSSTPASNNTAQSLQAQIQLLLQQLQELQAKVKKNQSQ